MADKASNTTDNKQLWADYEEALRCHDWTYNYANGERWREGDRQRGRIMTMKLRLSQIDKERAEKMFDEYRK